MRTWADPRGGSSSAPELVYPGITLRPQPSSVIDTTFEYHSIARTLVDNGWSVFPQQYRDGQRKPGIAGGRLIRPLTEHHLDRRLPTADEVTWWSGQPCGRDNPALMTGEVNEKFGVWSLDFDVLDEDLMSELARIASEVLGHTPFRRGRSSVCKQAWIYRRPIGALRLPAKRFVLSSIHQGQVQAIELQDDGGQITLYNRHYKTGEFFKWLGEAEPYNASPEIAPEVAEAQIIEFLHRVHAVSEITGFDKAMRQRPVASAAYADTDVSDVRVPRISDDHLPPGGGLLTDGRKSNWLMKRALPFARLNAGLVAPLHNGQRVVSVSGIRHVAVVMAEEASAYIKLSSKPNDDLTEGTIVAVCAAMLTSAANRVASGDPDYAPTGTIRAEADKVKAVPKGRQHVLQNDNEFAWVPSPDQRKEIKGLTISDPDPSRAAAVALRRDRADIRARVSRQVRRAIKAWLLAVARHDPDGNKPLPTLLLKAPTGAGKTTALVRSLGELKREHPDLRLGPILMMLPSYANIDEVVSREDLGVWTAETESRAAEILEEANGAGVRVMTFRGKIAAGCREAEKVKALMERQISTSGLCRQIIEDGDGGKKEVFCRWHPNNPDRSDEDEPCRAILQQLEIMQCDIVLAPHAFIHTNIPKALKQVAAVVIDEKIWDKTVGIYEMPIDLLNRGRDKPPLTKSEREARPNFDTEEWLNERMEFAAPLAIDALLNRRDVAADFLDWKIAYGNVELTGEDLVERMLKVTGRTQVAGMQIHPGMPAHELNNILDMPKATKLLEEQKFWSLVSSRLQQLKEDKLLVGLATAGNTAVPFTRAKGKSDARIKLQDGDHVRLQWRRKLNFADKPILFLDASGEREILAKIFDRKINTVEIKAPLHMRVLWVPDGGYAKSGILPDPDDGAEQRRAKAFKKTLLREALTTVGFAYADSGIVAGSAMGVRTFLNSRWAHPDNMAWMHFGAVRGLDWAKSYGAAVSIGCLNLADRDVDSYVAALSHDDDEPETPVDVWGNGRIGPEDDAKPLPRRYVTREVPLRDGSMATVDGVHEYEKKWARLIQHQVREEELAQFGGRLRPVYREGEAPVWVVVGKVLPAGVVVDEIASLIDVARPTGRSTRVFDAVRHSGGLIDVNTTNHPYFDANSAAAMVKLVELFKNNPRWSRPFHEIAYRPLGDYHEDFPAWVAATSPDPIGQFKNLMAWELASEPRLVRAARVLAREQPPVHQVDAVLGSLESRREEEKSDFVALFARVEWGELKFSERRLGICIAGGTVTADEFMAIEAMQRVKALEVAGEDDHDEEAATPPRREAPASVFFGGTVSPQAPSSAEILLSKTSNANWSVIGPPGCESSTSVA